MLANCCVFSFAAKVHMQAESPWGCAFRQTLGGAFGRSRMQQRFMFPLLHAVH